MLRLIVPNSTFNIMNKNIFISYLYHWSSTNMTVPVSRGAKQPMNSQVFKSLNVIILNEKNNIYCFYLQSRTLSCGCSTSAKITCQFLEKACPACMQQCTPLWAVVCSSSKMSPQLSACKRLDTNWDIINFQKSMLNVIPILRLKL